MPLLVRAYISWLDWEISGKYSCTLPNIFLGNGHYLFAVIRATGISIHTGRVAANIVVSVFSWGEGATLKLSHSTEIGHAQFWRFNIQIIENILISPLTQFVLTKRQVQ